MFFQLSNDQLTFPSPELAEEDGLLAIGGDLSVDRLILAYLNGIFPWFDEGDPILWYAPHQRCVIYPKRLNISKSMKKILKQNLFEITVNQDFEGVIDNCAKKVRKGQDGTWITSSMQSAYINLYHEGLASSIEIWQDDKLVGGLYGVLINRVFCGESMFSHVSNASKIALIYLCNNFAIDLVDCQLPNEHLMSMGAEMIDLNLYLSIIRNQ